MSLALEVAQKSVAPLALGVFALFPPQVPPGADRSHASVPTEPNLSGRFERNAADSEDAREKLRRAMEGRRARGGPGGGGRPMGEPPPGDLRQAVLPPVAMTITQTRNEVVVMEQDGRLRTLHPDGKSYKAEGGAVEVTTHWDAGRLVVETRSGRGPKLSETWSLDPGSGRLSLTMAIEARGGASPVTIRSVYDRAS